MKWYAVIPAVAVAAFAAACGDGGPTATSSRLAPRSAGAFDKVAATGSVTGALFTTDVNAPSCGAVNVNQYDTRKSVYVNGGGNGANQLPNGWYYVRVVAPGGDVLGTSVTGVGDPQDALTLEVANNSVVGCPRLWDLVKQPDGNGGWSDGFAVSTNGGGVYKVEIGTNPTFENSKKSDNFKINEGIVVEPNLVLDIDKTMTGAFNRTYKWTIGKSCDESVNATAPGTTVSISCSVVVGSGTPVYEDGGYSVSGDITITNPSQTSAVTVSNVIDNLVGTFADQTTVAPTVTVSCSGQTGLSFIIAKGGEQKCSYSYTLTKGQELADFANTATVHYNDGAANTSASSNQYTVDFDTVTPTAINKKVTVTDSKYTGGSPAGTLGTVEYGVDALPKTFGPFTYSATAPVACTSAQASNTATITETGQWSTGNTTINTPCGLTVRKFYDANGNGTLDAGEPEFGTNGLAGWKMTVSGPNSFSQSGNTVFTPTGVFAGTYSVSEGVTLPTGWTMSAAYTYFGGTDPKTGKGTNPQSVTLNSNNSNATTVFGNYCTVQAAGWTLGFWSNNNGQARLATSSNWQGLVGKGTAPVIVTTLIGGTSLSYKLWQAKPVKGGTAVSQFLLGNTPGVPSTNKSGATGNYQELQNWLLGAQASTNGSALYMLSAQFAAAIFNVQVGGSVDGTGNPVKLDVTAVLPGTAGKTIGAVLQEVAQMLNSTDGTDRATYSTYIGYLNQINNKANVIPATPCAGFPTVAP